MAEPQTPDRREPAPSEPKLYTLSEISQRSGISMPTLQRYKKTYQGRIPSVGSGRKQRYPEHALPVFAELRSENAGKRGRPRKDASAARPTASAASSTARRAGVGRRPATGKAKPAASAAPKSRGAQRATATKRGGRGAASAVRTGRAAASSASAAAGAGRRTAGRPAKRGSARATSASGSAARGARGAGATGSNNRGKTSGLLTLTQISETTKISYPTLVRYVRLYSDRLPHEGKGRARRFYPEAVEVFRSLRQESGRSTAGRRATGGRPAGRAAAAKRPALRRGRPPKAAASTSSRLESILADRIRDLERFQQAIEKRFGDLVKGLQKLR